ncbi:cytochrome C oxidase subunit IV family protein [Arcicella sp. DC2W]|uniref:Cytochrome C oxidase subunit IV family protein n=1 Tax=Arcicella gelida TaxID=2984195 RepID=A0ABU5S0Z3_9BACT|nr:cytochrome C oxidase subunit IV family protein [Arcicella sp. DC2W]MEA5402139.1 cytochrome C oxidase subunit IV family protein [Arcicella sp. DC2W]
MASHNHSSHADEKVIPPAQTAAIWKTFWILLILTAIEFVIAFTLPANHTRVAIFVVMTIVKAFFIVGEFMHLKHEVKTLIWSILIPTIFVVWLLIALIYEGGHLY